MTAARTSSLPDRSQTTHRFLAMPFLAKHKRRPRARRDGIAAWLRDEIGWLESIDRTEHGDGAMAAYKATLRELETIYE